MILAKTAFTDVTKLDEFVKSKNQSAVRTQDTSTETTYLLQQSSFFDFSKFFNSLDLNIKNLNIATYGVKVTTLEDVFLEIGFKITKNLEFTPKQLSLTTYKANIDERSTWRLFKVFVLKKLLVMVRNRSNFLMDLIIPCVMIVGGLYISKLDFVNDSMPARNLSVYDFPKSVPLIRNLDSFYSS